MEMSQGGEGMRAANDNQVEAPKETVRALDRSGLIARLAEIAALSDDALNVSKSLDKQGFVPERKAMLAQIAEALREMHPKKLVLVTETDGKITGCVIVDKSDHARVENLWLAAGTDQVSIIQSLVNSALAGLKHGPRVYDRLHIGTEYSSRSASLHNFLTTFPENNAKLVIEGAASDKEKQSPLENAA